MTHSIVIGGQPDYLTAIVTDEGNVFPWFGHGREITTGDAERVLDLAPSVRYRAASIGSGEFRYFHRFFPVQLTLAHMIGAIVHNLDGVGAYARMVTASSDCFSQVMPAGAVVASTNTASVAADVDQDPFGTVTTFATPTVKEDDWFLEVAFANASALSLVANSQTVYVYLRWTGGYVIGEDTALVTIQVKEGADVRATKTLRLRPPTGETFVVAVLVDPNDFDDTTLDGMSVRVTCEGFDPVKYWEFASIIWQRQVDSGVEKDTGWIEAETVFSAALSPSDPAQVCSVLPFLDINGEVTAGFGPHVYFMLYWDDSIDQVATGRPRIFFDPDSPATAQLGTPTAWRPEIGVIAEGPAYGTSELQFNPVPSWTDPSIVRMSKGGNDWVIRREARRRLRVGLDHISAADWAGSLFSVARRAGISRPFCVAFKPGSSFSAAVSAAASIYGKLVSFDSSNNPSTTAAPADGDWSVSMTFEEVV